VDKTKAEVDASLSSNNARLIYVDAYDTASGERFATVSVPNAGSTARTWWWYADTTSADIANKLNTNGARLAEVKSYFIGPDQFFLAIMVKQTGIDAKNWTWGTFQTAANIQTDLTNFHYRLLSLESNPFGGFDYVMVQSYGEAWSWAVGLTSSAVTTQLTQNSARLTNISRYVENATTKFAVVMVENTNAQTAAINAESQRVATILAVGLSSGEYGVYLKKVGGPVTIGINQGFRFEPASAIKVLYHLYAVKQVQAGADSLSSNFDYYPDPSAPGNGGVCPDPAWQTSGNVQHTTLGNALTLMMMQSDNVMTRGMVLRYGIANVASYATSIGLGNTRLKQGRIGCLFVNGLRNQFTLADAGKLYEQVDNGSLLNASSKTAFYSRMVGGAVPSASPLGDVVRDEANKQGKLGSAAAFIAKMAYREKAGNEFQCVSINCGTTPQYLDFTAVAGRMTLPFKSGGNIVSTSYVYGRFANDFILGCLPGSGACAKDVKVTAAITTLGTGGVETYRAAIAAALATW
jgi:beta-lactamase class A